MKKTYILKAILLSALPFASQALAQEEPTLFPGTVAKVTFSLTISSEVEGTVNKDQFGKPIKKGDEGAGPDFSNTYDVVKKEVKVAEVTEYVSKIGTRKYSLKEFLTDLVELDVIEDIKGYSLVNAVATATEGDEISQGARGFFLIKKGEEPIDVSDYFYIGSSEEGVIAETEVTETPFAEGEPTTPVEFSYSAKFKGEGYIGIELDIEEVSEEEYSAQGTFTGSVKTGTVGKEKTPVFIPGAGKLTGAIGEYSFDDLVEETSTSAFVEGSAAISAGAPSTDVSSFFPVID